ncbi:unnamed protein product [Rhizophagus irregularis]|nr:unnamed protein product [Rhizophagus irregularis]CAB5373306.1 unnamed protein product [Rhizophagus irregularis]
MIVLQLGQYGNNIPREILTGLDEEEFYSDDDLYYELSRINKSVERSCLPKSNPMKTAMVHDSSSESSESSGGEFFDTVIPKKKQE